MQVEGFRSEFHLPTPAQELAQGRSKLFLGTTTLNIYRPERYEEFVRQILINHHLNAKTPYFYSPTDLEFIKKEEYPSSWKVRKAILSQMRIEGQLWKTTAESVALCIGGCFIGALVAETTISKANEIAMLVKMAFVQVLGVLLLTVAYIWIGLKRVEVLDDYYNELHAKIETSFRDQYIVVQHLKSSPTSTKYILREQLRNYVEGNFWDDPITRETFSLEDLRTPMTVFVDGWAIRLEHLLQWVLKHDMDENGAYRHPATACMMSAQGTVIFENHVCQFLLITSEQLRSCWDIPENEDCLVEYALRLEKLHTLLKIEKEHL